MITLYTTPSSASCRKAKSWLEENNLPFIEKNIFNESLTISELKAILRLTENGTEDIISYRSQAFQNLNVPIDEFSLSEVLELIQEEPSLIRRPILIDEKRLQIGFNDDDIRRFLPREVRRIDLLEMQKQLSHIS
ncbi:MAG: transcriptional regulator SpxA [Carnobacterium sp.]|uniref:Regulatory protein spx n=1 Tax=Carnobacterium viridans TaxID=174587 RepID=A0A1H0ZAJ2_9LACT|nr:MULTISPECIES: transcriptional regulator SpxA [Carnobacterium]AEB30701.1 regulatory protein spx [Carnobacterium sp. 17-4]UDE94730.1 transcriptional regulator SpxA [Carnobacterium viridans]SDQ24414.1 regulatory protein spx [Carnobacterium viridans]